MRRKDKFCPKVKFEGLGARKRAFQEGLDLQNFTFEQGKCPKSIGTCFHANRIPMKCFFGTQVKEENGFLIKNQN